MCLSSKIRCKGNRGVVRNEARGGQRVHERKCRVDEIRRDARRSERRGGKENTQIRLKSERCLMPSSTRRQLKYMGPYALVIVSVGKRVGVGDG